MIWKSLNFNTSIVAFILFSYAFTPSLQAQSHDICEDNDCPATLFSIQLNEPLNPPAADGFKSERTNNFITAYKKFQQVKSTYADSDWQTKRNASQIGGKSCLRHYQLESKFAYEYSQNPDFKKFIDNQNSGSGDFMEDGFESSRRD